ncbi:DUF1622 domain-containing protein [Phenylobacterium sp.]|uniref:DUF1622 domain-containing protein n=1 Tax=Phenylobacterium sp. TaxID=1871053 RepID=UPI00351DA57D
MSSCSRGRAQRPWSGVSLGRRHHGHGGRSQWTEIGQLAAIAALRTALKYFIQRELNLLSVRAS